MIVVDLDEIGRKVPSRSVLGVGATLAVHAGFDEQVKDETDAAQRNTSRAQRRVTRRSRGESKPAVAAAEITHEQVGATPKEKALCKSDHLDDGHDGDVS